MQLWSFEVLVVVILVVTFLASYVLELLGSVFIILDTLLSPDLLDNVTKVLSAIRDIFFSLLEIILIVGLIYSLYLLRRWVQKDDNDVFIQPFIVGTCDGKYDGAAISDLLIAELLRIQSIHKTRKMPKESGQIEDPKETFVSQTRESKETSDLFAAVPGD